MTYLPPRTNSENISTTETTTSTSYTDLTTTGPSAAIVAPFSGAVYVTIGAQMQNNTAGEFCLMSFATTDAGPTVAASDGAAVAFEQTGSTSGQDLSAGRTFRVTGLTAGTTYTFRAKYRVTAGTGTFLRRHLTVEAK